MRAKISALSPQFAERNGDLRVGDLRTEYEENPLAIDSQRPRLSWRLYTTARATVQVAYQIKVATTITALNRSRNLVWDSGRVASSESIFVPYSGRPLEARQRYFWKVRIWDSHGRRSSWSALAYWEVGLLSEKAWKARWIEPQICDGLEEPLPAPMLRREFHLNGSIRRARAYVTSRGLYELYLNGERVGRDLFTPGWTSYHKRLQYQTYDVTALIKNGANAIGAVLGDGWYRGPVSWTDNPNYYGRNLALLMQLEVTYKDGKRTTVISDGRWKAATGPILMSQIYAGEIYDARLERAGWTDAGYDDEGWTAVNEAAEGPTTSKTRIVSRSGPPVRRIDELRPIQILRAEIGPPVVDFGQNLTGWIRLRVSGMKGATVTLRHAEIIDQQGSIYTDNLRTARQAVQYILKGQGEEMFEPHFTFQGFRYVAVEGYPGELKPESLTAMVVHSDMERTGEFKTSNALINRLQHNILWSQKGNFLDVPTDCPQRNERLGWTGDAQVFTATAAFNMNVNGFFAKWLADLRTDQYPDGAVPFVVPDVLGTTRAVGGRQSIRPAGAAGWGDAATVIPWNVYLAYGDTQLLASQYPSMVNWVRYQQTRTNNEGIWDGDDFQFGDWLDFFSSQERGNFGTTSVALVATAYHAHSVNVLRQSARVLGKSDDSQYYESLFERICTAFRRQFVCDDGRIDECTQTAYVLALDFDLLPETLRNLAAARLAEDVRTRGHLTTGFLGTPHLLMVLSRFGYVDEAYRLLLREEFPSWLYPVRRGATTVWERWDGIRPDGGFQDPKMNSFNHYAYGAVGEWMYRVAAGIQMDPAAPGYRHILISPKPGGDLTFVRARHLSPYGRVCAEWRRGRRFIHFDVEIPPNSTATIQVDAQLRDMRESGRSLVLSPGIASVTQSGATVVIKILSGQYSFRYPASPSLDRTD